MDSVDRDGNLVEDDEEFSDQEGYYLWDWRDENEDDEEEDDEEDSEEYDDEEDDEDEEEEEESNIFVL